MEDKGTYQDMANSPSAARGTSDPRFPPASDDPGEQNRTYRDRSKLLWLLGGLLLLAGACAAFIGPIEIHTFNLFSEGGRFHYEGFGFGSLMFGNITVQVAGYYLIAVIGIMLGVGHLTVRRWARKLTLTLLYDWLVLGLPLSIVLFLMLLTSKDLPPSACPS